jgi:uncharacterized spore protein YtfJ
MDEKDEVMTVIDKAKDAMSVKRVFGDPYEKNGVTIIPAARVAGGAGGGSGEQEGQGQGRGSGFGVNAKPAGAFVFNGDKVTWQPAIDATKIVIGMQLVVVAALLLVRAVVKSRAHHHEP